MPEWWDEPVPVRMTAGLTFQVADPERAATILLNSMPRETTKSRAARKALLLALERAGDHKRASAARKAFAAAIEEAGMLGAGARKPR